jgi:rare lipoprotein A
METRAVRGGSSILFLALGLLLLVGCAHRGKSEPVVAPPSPTPLPVTSEPASPTPKPTAQSEDKGYTEKGIASWYGEPYHGRRTASGEIYDMHQLTAAHKSLVFGSVVKVTRRDTGAGVTVRINDRGPFIEGRIIDLSYAAAKKIALDIDGIAPVKIKVVGHEAATKQTPNRSVEPEICLWVQIGAFSDRGNAAGAERELESTGEVAVMLEGLDGLWRVRVGPFDQELEAERARNRITDAWPGSHIVPCGG